MAIVFSGFFTPNLYYQGGKNINKVCRIVLSTDQDAEQTFADKLQYLATYSKMASLCDTNRAEDNSDDVILQ